MSAVISSAMISAVGLVQWSASGPMRVSSCYERSLVGLHLRAKQNASCQRIRCSLVCRYSKYSGIRVTVYIVGEWCSQVTDDGRGKPDLAERPHIGPGRGLIQFP